MFCNLKEQYVHLPILPHITKHILLRMLHMKWCFAYLLHILHILHIILHIKSHIFHTCCANYAYFSHHDILHVQNQHNLHIANIVWTNYRGWEQLMILPDALEALGPVVQRQGFSQQLSRGRTMDTIPLAGCSILGALPLLFGPFCTSRAFQGFHPSMRSFLARSRLCSALISSRQCFYSL